MELALSTSEEGKDRLRNAKLRLDVHTAELGMEMADAPTVPKEVRIEEPVAAPQGETIPEEASADQTMDGEDPMQQTEQFNLDDDDMDSPVARPQKYTEVYIGTPDRPRVDKRRGGEADDDAKARRFDSPTPTEVPEAKARKVEDEIMGSMNEIDRRIMASVILGVDITEVFSPERVAGVAKRYGLVAGSSFDLTNGWDFNVKEHREECWRRIKKECPYLLIGSPPCT